jgi:predicted GNAT superfamily acetyltransferase
MNFTIRDLSTYEEMLAVHRLQQEIWGLNDPTLGLHPPLLKSAANNGGVVLGAFAEESGQMVAFLAGFLGREPGGPLKLCSQAMGVLPAWRGRGVAEALKQAQRYRVIAQGLPLITWTFDPLEGPNAHLNLHKLRGISRRYERDYYGADLGRLNTGLPTDRLVVEWWVNGARLEIKPKKRADTGTPIFETEGHGLGRRIVQAHLALEEDRLQLQIPAELHSLKAADLALALDWRLQVRTAFEAYLAQDYWDTDFR